MKAEPLTYAESRPAAFITAAGSNAVSIATYGSPSETYQGTEQIVYGIFEHGDYALYSLVPLYLLPDQGDPRIWTLYRYGKSWTRAAVGKVQIYGLVGFGQDPMQLEPFFDAMSRLGIRYRSQATMTRDLWRYTLRGPVVFGEDKSESGYVGRRALRPGRREAIPGRYRGTTLVDIPAAYPTAMAAQPLPMRLRTAEPWWYESGIAEAQVSGGLGNWTMLPRGVKSKQVLWTFDELRLAVDHGSDVQIIRAWQGENEADLFSAWFDLIMALREELPGQSAKLIKTLANRLWASFSFDPRAKYSRTTFAADGTPFIHYLNHGVPSDTAYLSAIIQGRVNARLYEEGLRRGAVFCETDSAIVPDTVSSNITGWRIKGRIADLEIASAKAMRFKCGAGVSEHLASDGCAYCAGSRWHIRAQGCIDDSSEAELQWRKESQHAGVW